MYTCYTLVADLKNLVQEKQWKLTLKFQNYYCAFYIFDSRVFGINLYSSPRLAVWIKEHEAENLRNYCNFANYSASHRHAVYPEGTTVVDLLPILKFAYNKHKR